MRRWALVMGLAVALPVVDGWEPSDRARADESAKASHGLEFREDGCQPDTGLPIISLRPPGMPTPPPLSGSILQRIEPAMSPTVLDEDLSNKVEPQIDLNAPRKPRVAIERSAPKKDTPASDNRTEAAPPDDVTTSDSAPLSRGPVWVARRPERTEPDLEPAEEEVPVEMADRGVADPLDAKISQVLEIYRTKHYSTDEISPWGIMHSIVAYGTDSKVRIGHTGQLQPAIGWLCFNQRCRGLNLFHPRRNGFGLNTGPGYQGHHGQLLAILAQSRLKRDYPIRVNGRDFTIEDLIAYEQRTCLPRTELTFKLIGLGYYLPSDATWTSETGEEWTIPRLIAEEIVQPIRGAACGGTHRLFGLNFAVHRRRLEGKPIDGQFLRAQKYISDYHRYTFSLQNGDGSFSTEWFRGRGNRQDADRKIKTTGHILEFMSFSLPDDAVRDPRVAKAANMLADLMIAGQHRKLEIGPQGHAINALRIYQRRVFGAPAPSANPVSNDVAPRDDVESAEPLSTTFGREEPAVVATEPETDTSSVGFRPAEVTSDVVDGTPSQDEVLRQVRLPNLPAVRATAPSNPRERRLRLVP